MVTERCAAALIIIRGALILGLLIFYLFCYVPSMRSQMAYREAMDKTFGDAQACWDREFNRANFSVANSCFNTYYAWKDKNPIPEMGWNWPWRSWKESY